MRVRRAGPLRGPTVTTGPARTRPDTIHRPCVAKVQLAGLFEPESYCSFYFRTWNRGPSRKLEMDSKLNFEIGNNSKSVTMLTHHCRGAAARARPRSRAAVIGSKSRPNLKHCPDRGPEPESTALAEPRSHCVSENVGRTRPKNPSEAPMFFGQFWLCKTVRRTTL